MNKDQSVNKDIVYIDVEDDVTSVISKLRASKEKIVALVPPKNIGALQSAVNLRLLTRAADNAGKRIVLITNNSGLTALASGVKIPVARNLQSKPEIPSAVEAPADAEDDVIKGEDLPVGELALATTAAAAVETEAAAAPVIKPSDDDITITELPDLEKDAPVAAASVGAAKTAGPKVPNFDRFRKWIFIGGGALVAIILFFVLTNIFAANATIVIAAQSSDVAVDLPLTLTTTGSTNPDQATIKAVSKTLKKTASVDFTPTGTKNVGNQATGSINLTNNTTSSQTIAAGAQLTDTNNLVFTLDKTVTVPAGSVSCPTIFSCSGTSGKATDTVTAIEGGAKYNGSTGTLDGTPDGITATLASATSGGTDKTATVVTSNDIATATTKLAGSNATDAKAQLTSQFGSDYVVIGDSFSASDGNVTSTPAQDAQATTAKLTRDSTYTLFAIAKSEIKTVSTAYLTTQLSGNDQKIYDDGSGSAQVSQFITSPSGVQTLHVLTTGKTGPNIDETALKTQLVGKKSAEISQQIEMVNGVKNVTVSFAPFWRSTAPSADKIKISFDLSNGN